MTVLRARLTVFLARDESPVEACNYLLVDCIASLEHVTPHGHAKTVFYLSEAPFLRHSFMEVGMNRCILLYTSIMKWLPSQQKTVSHCIKWLQKL